MHACESDHDSAAAKTATNNSVILTDQAAATTLDPRFECPICLGCLREPLLTSCGHRFCKECINEWLQKKDGRCPIDNRVLGEKDLIPDKGVLAEIMEPFLGCPFASRGCKDTLSPWELESHVVSCLFQNAEPISGADGCQWCGAALQDEEQLQKHLDDECAKVPCSCRFREVGCRATVPRADLPAHLDSQIHDHLNLVSAAYNKLSVLVREQSRDLIDFKSQEADKRWEAPPKAEASSASAEHQAAEEGAGELLKSLFERVVALEQRNREQAIQIENLRDIAGSSSLQSGHYVWHLRGVQGQLKAMQAALPGLKMLYSAPFRTAPFGYSFCVRLNLNPAGSALSLHVHLVRGEHDVSLEWPFKGRIALIAANQRRPESHIQETMFAESHLAAFQRPQRDLNPRGFGFAEFVSLHDLLTDGFIKDDSIIIRVHIESSD
ncbi:TNF receptor-associated factor 6-A-like [Neocloeon triangulifer]|uniref:TNF receptor-associated factor 6-A-like n=1 Tax=Neocloeon triangulifer TaxID=2078957 RepID=UPI00286FA8F0|nr:TNF receptor-associated factor 6-A-like [Neocloeon triangulifer]